MTFPVAWILFIVASLFAHSTEGQTTGCRSTLFCFGYYRIVRYEYPFNNYKICCPCRWTSTPNCFLTESYEPYMVAPGQFIPRCCTLWFWPFSSRRTSSPSVASVKKSGKKYVVGGVKSSKKYVDGNSKKSGSGYLKKFGKKKYAGKVKVPGTRYPKKHLKKTEGKY